jgi:cytochrome c5
MFCQKRLIALAVSLLTLSACGKSSENEEAPQISAGEALVNANCKVCHAQGINGAPIIGNSKMWSGRLEKGLPALTQNAINGVGLMPARGGSTLSDDEIAEAVSFMVSKINN